MSPELTFLLIAAVIVVVAGVAVVVSRRKSGDGVDSFRRQIDALSPEARRTVVDQVQNVAERDAEEDDERGA